jgi:hypothetical protein
MTDDAQLTTAISARIILPLDEAAGALSLPSSELARLTRIRDIAFIEFQGQLLFRIEALRDWAQRHETRAWAPPAPPLEPRTVQ